MGFYRGIIGVFLCIPFFLTGQLIQVEKIGELQELWEGLDEKSLVVFDIDDVIISTEDHFSHPHGYPKFVELTHLALERAKEEEKEEIMHKVSLSQILSKRKLVEEGMPRFIQNLQESGIKVIALTNFPRGQYGVISRTETWRLEQMRELGIDFSKAFPDEKSHEFHEMIRKGFASPLFEEGILFANGQAKGEVLKAFFQKSGYYPSKVVFIDDMLVHHSSVEAVMASLEIPCVGVHYVGASKYFRAFNEALIRFQFEHLLSTSTWLSDEHILELWQQE